MKTLLRTFCFVLFAFYANCQTLPLSSLEEPNTGGYLKDIDNVLPFWEDTWKGTTNNKEYTFQFTVFLHHLTTFSSERYYYIDKLVGKFRVIDLITGQELYNDLAVTNFDDYKIELLAYGNNIGYVFSFTDSESHCNNSINFTLLRNGSNTNEIIYTAFEYNQFFLMEDCPYTNRSDIPMFLPTQDFVLTRQ
ncbi:hypothetical protein DI487_07875 [Flavobacterium sediminis]|uniref:Uncharacterized protein n=1 Tax=Flavobacterium sediminis TaxID=2201181 RepID=A0A2U8QUF1_9FLAO|nr:hypothetical protein [Flavobacterium sediminis]AWM13788.1 hypothetical protein DI487_07875 [Flavobacterium sediminis]